MVSVTALNLAFWLLAFRLEVKAVRRRRAEAAYYGKGA